MPESGGQERTEKATPKKRKEARRKGQVAQSKEVTSVLILIAALGFFYFAGAWMFWNLSELIGGVYQNIDTLRINTAADMNAFSVDIFSKLFSILIPFFLPILIVAAIAKIARVLMFDIKGNTSSASD